MLFPKKVKHRKWHKFRVELEDLSPETRGTSLSYGAFGLKAQTAARVTSNQIESARKALARSLGKNGKVWIRIFPDRPMTQKAAEVPMGKGKGDLTGYMFEVRPGRVLFEVDGIERAAAHEGLKKAAGKLPLKAKVVERVG